MDKKQRRTWMAPALACVLFIGCESQNMYRQDPLLLTRQPIEGKVDAAAPTLLALAEPKAPPFPPTVVVWTPKTVPESSEKPKEAVAAKEPARLAPDHKLEARPVASPKGPVPVQPAVRSRPPSATIAAPEPHGFHGQILGHAGDYHWLQGVLEKHSQGHFELRFCDPTQEDQWGGKVQLKADPRLQDFQEGDVVYIEGILTDSGQTKEFQHPLYQVNSIRLIRKGN